MRPFLFPLLLVAVLLYGCERPTRKSETLEAAGGQKIVKDYSSDGKLKAVTRLNPNGSLLGTLSYSNGVSAYAHYFDDQKRVRRTLLYRPDGTASLSREFDEHGKVVAEAQFDASGQPIDKETP